MSKLGRILVDVGVITGQQLKAGERLREQTGMPLDLALISNEAIREIDLVETLAAHFEIPVVEPNPGEIPKALSSLVAQSDAEAWRAIPVAALKRGSKNLVQVAVADPSDEETMRNLRRALGSRLTLAVAPSRSITRAIRSLYAATTKEEMSATADGNKDSAVSAELKALTRMVKAMRDLLIEKGYFEPEELEEKLQGRIEK